MSNERQILEMWINGRMVHSPETMYKGGQKHEFLIDLDLLNLTVLYELYYKYGGTKSVVDFYYLLPGYSLRRWELRLFPPYIVDLNMVGEDDAIPGVNDPVHEVNNAEVHEDDDAEPGVNDPVHEEDDAEPEVNAMNNEEEVHASPIQEEDQRSRAAKKGKGISTEEGMQTEARHSIREVKKRKEKGIEEECEEIEEGEMDDVAEDDRANDEFSDALGFLLEDIEGSSDDDNFTEKNPSKQTLYKRLRKFMAANKKEDDYLISLDESENENEDRGEQRRRHTYFRKADWNMKGKNLLKGMKFQNYKVYREAMRDYCVRMGVDLHFIRNEASRITARLAKTKYIAKRLEKIIRDYPFVSTEQLKNNVSRRIGLEVSAAKIARAKNEAIAKIIGEDGKQYEMLWDDCETVRVKNPGSLILLRMKEGAEPPVFDKMYFSLAAMKNGFLAGCKPVLQLDECFLKTLFGGQLLVVVGEHGNDNMVPITLAIVQVENLENWKWFLSVMLEDIGGLDQSHRWTFITDGKKGLLEAIAELAPYAEYRYCVRHMYENFKKKYSSTKLKNIFWSAVSSANRADFEMYIQRITTSNCDLLVNNLSESFNNMILPARDKPIISMFEWIRRRLMSRIQKKREGMKNYASVICPNIRKKVDKEQSLARHCWARFCGGSEFEIDHFLDKYVVDLQLKTCICSMFQLCGYLCCHACAAISKRRVSGQGDYIKINYPILRAPAIKRKRGRPRKRRIRGAGEGVDNTKTPAEAEEEPYQQVQTDHETVTQSSSTPQPIQASQNDPSSQSAVLGNTSRNSRPRKQSSRGGSDKGRTYLRRRNVALLSVCSNVNQQSSSNVPTETATSVQNPSATATDSTRGKTAPSSIGRTGAAVAGTNLLPKTTTSRKTGTSSGTKSTTPTPVGKKRKPSIADALKNIR
ncbi:hypothetical protein BUALT_Bualt06G0050200 [Buddleja alternifolia]|uniref:SWIM-type domain-containing protein n=1 Tax=Buddleja alternifolia TaxID=168488 RepID=A0AAV6XD28_9LAMI|nr:hypothetical protein BUALT_Bualt06G0050200 [Buddleja alternifolia]